jgi:hypothetical protein
LLVEVLPPNLYRVIAQPDAPFISVVDINAKPAPLADDICIDPCLPFIFDQAINKDFTIQPDWFVVCQFPELFALFSHGCAAGLAAATALAVHTDPVFSDFFFLAVHWFLSFVGAYTLPQQLITGVASLNHLC